MLRGACVFALNQAIAAGDVDECQRLIFSYLPNSDPSFQQEMYRFLDSAFRTAGRQAEIRAFGLDRVLGAQRARLPANRGP